MAKSTYSLRGKWREALVASVLAALSAPSLAAVGENIGVSLRAMSLGNAVTADPGGIEAVHYNPAGLTHLTGKRHDLTLMAARVRTFAEFNAPDDYKGIFGFKEDPVIGQRSTSADHAFYIPGIGLVKPKVPVIVAPMSGFSYNEPESRFTFADMLFAPQLVAYDRSRQGDDDPTRFGGRTMVLQRFTYFAPSMGYKVSDTLSLGVTASLSHHALALNTDFRAPNQLLAMVGQLQKALCPEGGNPIDTVLFGLCSKGRMNPFNKIANLEFQVSVPSDPTLYLGFLWEPNDWFALGGVYQSESKMRMTGKYKFEYDPNIRAFYDGVSHSALGPIILAALAQPSSVPEKEEGNVTLTLPYPKHIQVGTKFKFGRIQLNGDVSWTNWKAWENFIFDFDQELAALQMARLFGYPDATKLVMPRGYKNTWSGGIGLQVDVTSKLRTRMGVEFRKSSVRPDRIDTVAPLSDDRLYGIGFGYSIDKFTDIDATIAFLHTRYTAQANSSCNLNCDNLLNVVYNPYAGLDVTTGLKVDVGGITIRKRF